MKLLVFVVFAILVISILPNLLNASPHSQSASEEIWAGALDISGVQLHIVVHIARKADGTYVSTMDSPDQGAKGIPIAKTTLADGKLVLEVTTVQGKYEGTISADGKEATGTWEQGGLKLPLTLKKVDKAPEIVKPKRPQTPNKPYPYKEQEVSYENKAAGIKLAGTLTVPRGKGSFPAVLLITGSGAQDRNEALLGHQPFLVLSDFLTRQGIAVLRMDDRGVGGSTGNTANSTTEDFVGDVLTGVGFLKSRKEIDAKHIGLIGHSEGGVIAPMAAARSKDVAFIVMMAGTGLPGDEIIYLQGRLIAKASGAPDADIDRSDKLQHRIFEFIKKDGGGPELEKRIQPLIDEIKASLPESDRKKAEAAGSFSPAAMKSVTSPWFRYFLTLDPRLALRKVKCPVLAINGEKDLQVPPKQNLPEITKALKQAENRDVTIKELSGLNHLFQKCSTGSPSEYQKIEETIDPIALKTMGDWIKKHAANH